MTQLPQLIIGDSRSLDDYLVEHFPTLGADPAQFAAQFAKLGAKQNLLYVTPAADKKGIGVEQVLGVLEFAVQRPHLSAQATVIIYPASKLNAEAQNKLLKLLEEPPTYLQFLLLTSSEQELLPTLKSRCELVRLLENQNGLPESKFTALVSDLVSGQAERCKSAYLELDKLLSAEKIGSDKAKIWEGFIHAFSQQLQTEFKHARGAELPRLKQLAALGNTLKRSQKFNANTKLLLDTLFSQIMAL